MADKHRMNEAYARDADTPAGRRRIRNRIEWICSYTRGQVLELGCGRGSIAAFAGFEGGQIIGIDSRHERLARTRDLNNDESDYSLDNVILAIAWEGELAFRDDCFDTVICDQLLQQLEWPGLALEEIARVLRPGGKAVITVPFGFSPEYSHKRTFYLSSFLELLTGSLKPELCRVVDESIRAVASDDRSSPETVESFILAGQPALEGSLLRAEQDCAALQLGRDQALGEVDKLRKELERAEGRTEEAEQRLQHATRQVQRLAEQKSVLEDRIASERSKVQSMRDRRWWQLGVALGEIRRDPRRLPMLPIWVGKLAWKKGRQRSKGKETDPTTRVGESRSARLHGAVPRKRDYLTRPSPRKVEDLRLGVLLDDMSYACFAPEAELVSFRPDNFEEKLGHAPPDFLLVESAWRGGGGCWQYMVGSYSYSETIGLPQLRSVLEWCRAEGVPTVFWNKEDPAHFNKFKEAASLFDYVFTTDANCVPSYRGLGVPDTQVSVLPFAAQPSLHNPVSVAEGRLEEACFAGTYYHNRHPERKRQLEMLLDVGMAFGLSIYDRTLGRQDIESGFPERFLPHVRGSLPYEEMVRAYKRYRIFLNVNSVVDSPTMFSRRVFELLACGTPVISTPSLGVEETFPGIVPTVKDATEGRTAVERLMRDDGHWRSVSTAGVRAVLSEHTYGHRLAAIANTLGISVEPPGKPAVSVIALQDLEDAGRLAEKLAQQKMSLEEVLVGSTAPEGHVQGVRVFEQDPNSDCRVRYRDLARAACSAWVAIVDPSSDYPPRLLDDMALYTLFARADVIGLPLDGREHRYVDAVDARCVVARREVIASRGWVRGPEELRGWHAEGVRIYAGNDFWTPIGR